MPLDPGTTLGPYSVTAKIGEGGMGEVYRARDTKLDRDVALKVLPQAFTDDPDRLARFEREAKVLASLNHPHIGGIYGLEEAEGTRALVLELIEGPTLADRIAQGPIPIDEALPIAKQIAEALEAAHEAGVIHRDLKPANIKVKDDGTVKVLDFGLAKALDTTPEGDPSLSPTLTAAATQMGVIMGTAAYMSPEQARGESVDKRADIWAFGCVLYEMLSGRRSFEGRTVSDTLASVLAREPDLDALPTDIPSAVRRLLRRCLEKEHKKRLRDIAEGLLQLEDSLSAPLEESTTPVPPAPQLQVWQRPMPAFLVALVAVALGGLAAWTFLGSGTQPPLSPKRFTVVLPGSDQLPVASGTLLALSPDGQTLVYSASRNGVPQLFRRPIDQFEAILMPGTEGSTEPFFSSDGQWVGFVASGGELRKVNLAGGPAQTLTALAGLRGADWGADEIIVFGNPSAGVMQIPSAGGEPIPLFTLDDPRMSWYPQVLAGGDAVLFTLSLPTPDAGELHLFMLETGEHRTLVPNAVAGRVLDTGHLVFVRSGALWAVPFDRDRLDIVGTPAPVVEGVRIEGGGAVQYALADDGSIVYVPGGSATGARRTLVWVNRDGQEEPLGMPPRAYDWPRVSPDGRRVIVDTGLDGGDLFLYNVETEVEQQFTTDPAQDHWPVFNSDGSVILFSSLRAGGPDLYRKAADGSGSTEALTSNPINQTAYDLSADGETLVITEFDPDTNWDIATLQIGDGSPPEKLLQTEYLDGKPAISPDRRWMAYTSDEPGGRYVYVRPYPDASSSDGQLITTDGDVPLWGPEGDELFYRTSVGDVMVVPVETGSDTFRRGTPTLLFPGFGYRFAVGSINWDVAPDGRFLMIKEGAAEGQSGQAEIHVVLNFSEELRRLFPDP
jgi:serine/threonine-protein kinase